MKIPFPARRAVRSAAFRQTDSALAEIRERLERLEKQLNKLTEQQQGHSHITVHTMNVEHPVIHDVTFRMDKLEIDELSGALNFGNNFGDWRKKITSSPAGTEQEHSQQRQQPRPPSQTPSQTPSLQKQKSHQLPQHQQQTTPKFKGEPQLRQTTQPGEHSSNNGITVRIGSTYRK